ncbi:MAG: flagellar hook-basal body complex protein FliE [Sedimentisphaerales bacterium]|jgi:flagellar hook-basal body complex protein FliE|nr:flagellar hook-basal body complex protein FliE [Sedimentisphaerales bacterium]
MNINPVYNPVPFNPQQVDQKGPVGRSEGQADFGQQIKKLGQVLASVDDMQKAADASIVDLLAGKATDITSVVSAVAKADMGFKLLVGVRNKLIEAYKQTMNMQL